MLEPLEQLELNQLPEKLQEAVKATEKDFSNWGSEIISITKMQFDRPDALGLKKILYKVILLVWNTFIILEQTTDDAFDLGVSKAMFTIGTIKEILDRAPERTGLPRYREAV